MRTALIHVIKSLWTEGRKLLLSCIFVSEQKRAWTTVVARGRIALGVMALLLVGASLVYAACMVYAVVATVPVGRNPVEVAVNPSTNRVYVTNVLGNSVSVIDGTTDNVIATISIGGTAGGVAVNTNTNRIYVASLSSHSVYVIDGTTHNVVSILISGALQPIAVNPATNRIYVVDAVGRVCCPQPNSTVHVIDGDTNSVVSAITVGRFSLDVAVNPTTNRIYVANTDSATISVIDGSTNMIVDTIALTSPVALAVNPATNRIYVAHSIFGVGHVLSVIDGTTDLILATVPAPAVSTTGAVAVDATRNLIYLSGIFSDTVSVFDGTSNALIATIPIDKMNLCCVGPVGVGVNPTTNRIYVADDFINKTSVIGLVTPQEAIQLLIDHVNRLVAAGALTQNQGDSLNVTLNLVKEKLSAGDTQGAMNALKVLDNAFINKVNALINSGNLTQAQGQALIDEANSLISQVGC